MFDQIDAAVFHPQRRAAYFFRGEHYVKYVPGKGVEPLGGSKLRRIGIDGWRTLPQSFRSDIDAVLLHANGAFYFFKGAKYVKYNPGAGVEATNNGQTIRTIGETGWETFPESFRNNIDAAFYCPDLHHAYFFKGDKYIKYKPDVGVVRHDGNPIRRIGVTGWQDLPASFRQNLSAALFYPPNELLYFFKSREYARWTPGRGMDQRYPRRLGLRHKDHGGWPGLSTLMATPITGSVTTQSASIWLWLSGGRTTQDISVALDGAAIGAPVWTDPNVGTELTSTREGVEAVDAGSRIVLLDIEGLASNSTHEVAIRRADDESAIETIRFKTAPAASDVSRVRFVVGSCANAVRETDISTYAAMGGAQPDLIVLCGDNCYYYNTAETSTGGASGDWNSVGQMFARQLEARNHPQLVPTLQSAPVLSTWDDHDFGFNNCDGWGHRNVSTWVRRDRAAGVYRAMWNHPYRNDANHIYYDVRWGAVHFFMTDGRYFSDRVNESGILGDAQVDSLIAALAASDAPLKVVVLGSQLIRSISGASFGQCASAERTRLLEAMEQNQGRVLIVSGDVHFSECQRLTQTPRFIEVTSSPLRVDDEKRENTKTNDPNRLWHTVRDNFVVVEVDMAVAAPSGNQGVVRIEARGANGAVLASAGPAGQCRTIWDLTTGALTQG